MFYISTILRYDHLCTMPFSAWRADQQLTSPQLVSVQLLHWLFIMTSSFGHAVSYLNLSCVFPWEIVVQMNPTVLDWKQWIFIFLRPGRDKPDLNYRKASQIPHNLPAPSAVCYEKSLLTKNRLYQKRNRALSFYKIYSMPYITCISSWSWL